ncbi:dienelactone hydrolase, putative [Talaromyces stipitatus ATCC 10500]|uniref:Dienelactone hydrolase, putative n=2 Tax=Talaromyces stipitatus TaxID=28564 RepID=B8LZ54_TALSN|nr:dienelactone hydrolase, putative [Talaromyces stipitatus ATCC 10500]AWS21680.1 putative dienelactone hydrolase [Talaromyces stipitatus]EED21098.1 dienelactone hydrolase, putative [Talaromyces stipitatus ATCC 10500]
MALKISDKVSLTVIRDSYSPWGSEETIGDVKTYTTGRQDATIGVIDVYDVFGISNHTQQGADLVASTLDAVVIVPDLLKGTYAKPEWFPLDSDEKRAHFFGFLKGYAAPNKHVDPLLEFMKHVQSRFPTVTKWGSFGLCWGAKVVALTSMADTPFKVSAQAHPGMLDPADAKKITIPHLVMASKDEPSEAVANFKTVIEKNGSGGSLTTYMTMHHGWMGSKANLVEEETFVGYKQGYTQLIEFFKEYLV